MPQHFAQLSDPHLSTLADVNPADLFNKRALGYLSWRRKRRFEHRREVLDALQRDLKTNAPEQLLITGDLTHIGLPLEFEQARDWLQQLGDPTQVALVPGNHDACVAAPWEKTFAHWQPYMAADENDDASGEQTVFPSLRVRGEIAFIGLSTACPKAPLMATGTVGAKQLKRLPAVLNAARDKNLFRVVYLHHCPIAGQEKWRKRLTDAAELQAVLEEHGAELVLHGHGHRAHYNELQTQQGSLPVIAVPSASALGLHGADVAHYNRYGVHRTEKGWELRITMRGFESASGEFKEDQEKTVILRRQ
jgi:3',5'-cyclic AMP phosphodiesterase CpdA